jgi:hypothetical protein
MTRNVGSPIALLEIWNVPGQKLIGDAIGKANQYISGVVFTPDGKSMVVGGTSIDKNYVQAVVLEVWNVTTGKVGLELPTTLTSLVSVALSPDGKTFAASGAAGTSPLTELWDVPTGKLDSTLPHSGTNLQISADGSVLRMDENGPIEEFSVPANVLLGSFTNKQFGAASAILFSGDSKSFAFFNGNTTGLAADPLSGELVSALTLSSGALEGGGKVTATVTMALPAPVGGTTVYLASSNPSVVAPATISIPAGARKVATVLPTTPVGFSTPVTLTAEFIGKPKTAIVTVLPPSLASFAVSPSSVKGSSTTAVTGTVTLSGAAPSVGMVVNLVSANPTAASLPATVTVQPGQTSATFTVSQHTVKTKTTVKLTASVGTTKTATLVVTP